MKIRPSRTFKAEWARLSKRQQRWVRAKAQWEHMSLLAVMNDWSVPLTAQLRPDGSWKPK